MSIKGYVVPALQLRGNHRSCLLCLAVSLSKFALSFRVGLLGLRRVDQPQERDRYH